MIAPNGLSLKIAATGNGGSLEKVHHLEDTFQTTWLRQYCAGLLIGVILKGWSA
jgi:hypothetical protein